MTIEQRIINVAEKQNYYDSCELRAIALEVRKMEDRIKQLEEMYEGEPGERPDLLGSNVMGLLKRELNSAQQRIKRLEDSYAAKDAQLSNLLHICRDNDIEVSSYDLIHRKEAKP